MYLEVTELEIFIVPEQSHMLLKSLSQTDFSRLMEVETFSALRGSLQLIECAATFAEGPG